jgi:hypothetical protein
VTVVVRHRTVGHEDGGFGLDSAVGQDEADQRMPVERSVIRTGT